MVDTYIEKQRHRISFQRQGLIGYLHLVTLDSTDKLTRDRIETHLNLYNMLTMFSSCTFI